MTFGIIGTNFISDWFLSSLPFADATATAVYSRRRETGEAFAAKHGISLVFDDLEQFLSSDSFEAVYIASPNFCHEAQSTLALRHGKHVLCEKPIAPSLPAFLRMQSAAKQEGRVLMEAMRPHHDSLWQSIKEHLPLIGRVRNAHLDFCQYSSRYARHLAGEDTNTFDPALSNAAMLDIGIYPIAAAVMLFGAPRAVSGKSVLLPSGFEGAGEAVLDYTDHVLSVSYSKVANSLTPSVILGEKGGVTIDKITFPTRAVFHLSAGEELVLQREKSEAPNNMHEEVLAFASAIREGYVSPFWEESAEALRICDTLRHAAGIRFPSDTEDTSW